jgi:hypothetical protein
VADLRHPQPKLAERRFCPISRRVRPSRTSPSNLKLRGSNLACELHIVWWSRWRGKHIRGFRMKRMLGGMVMAAALSGSAFAADLPSRTYAKAPAMAAPVYNWSGWYGGLNAGWVVGPAA